MDLPTDMLIIPPSHELSKDPTIMKIVNSLLSGNFESKSKLKLPLTEWDDVKAKCWLSCVQSFAMELERSVLSGAQNKPTKRQLNS